MSIKDNIITINKELPSATTLVAVSKFKPLEAIREAYNAGQRIFGESRPQELKMKAEALPKDIKWHFIGHLQSNKIKMVVPYVSLIHSIDSEKLLFEIDNYCINNSMKAEVLLEMHIAKEETKQGFSLDELLTLFDDLFFGNKSLSCVTIRGLMAMATFTDDEVEIREEFASLIDSKKDIDERHYPFLDNFNQLSFGMTNDYRIAAEMGSTMVRIGTAIFGER